MRKSVACASQQWTARVMSAIWTAWVAARPQCGCSQRPGAAMLRATLIPRRQPARDAKTQARSGATRRGRSGADRTQAGLGADGADAPSRTCPNGQSLLIRRLQRVRLALTSTTLTARKGAG